MRRNLAVSFVVVLVGASAIGFITPTPAAEPTAQELAPKLYAYNFTTSSGQFTQASAPAAVLTDVSRSAELAAGDVEDDAADEVVLGSGIGGNLVTVRPATGTEHSFVPFATGFAGGVTVAVGNLDTDAPDEIVVGMATGGSDIRIFNSDGTAVAAQFSAYEAAFIGGVRVAVADIDGDATNEIVAAPGPGRASTVKAFSASGAPAGSAVPFGAFEGGAFVAAANLDDDAKTEVVVGAGAGGGPDVKVLDGLGTPQGGSFASDPSNANGVRVSAGIIDGAKSIVVSTRTAAGGVIRRLGADGVATSAEFAVPGSDGDLALAITGGQIRLVDAAPRLITVVPTSVADHTRPRVRLYGAGLSALGDDITAGTDTDPILVTAVTEAADDLLVELAVPAGTPPGSTPLSVLVRTPGGTAAHELSTSLSVATRTTELRGFVTTGVVGPGGPHVRTFASQGPSGGGFYAGSPSSASGVRVARGDLDNDGVDEIVTAPGPGEAPTIRIFNSTGNEPRSFAAYGNAFNGGVFVAVGDVDPAPGNEIVTGADAGGGPHVQVFSASGALLRNLAAYPGGFTGGVRVATGDVDGDGRMEILTGPGRGGGPHVQALTSSGAVVQSFYAYESVFAGGVFVAGADVDGDGVDEIVTGPGAGGGPHVLVFSDGIAISGFYAFAESFAGGVSVGRFGDDILGPNAIVVGAGPGGGPHVRVLTQDGEGSGGFYAYEQSYTAGVFVSGGVG